MMKINKNKNINKYVFYKQFGDYWKESHKGKCTVPSQTRPSKQCAYRGSQVSSLGRVSL